MPLFKIGPGRKMGVVEQRSFQTEKELQGLIESNLQEIFNCRFVATEFSTGAQHAGRIDTLALSEDNNPVLIEYKKVEASDLVNQSLFYLSWLSDHRGDFEIAAQKALGGSITVDWSDIRVICIAPDYKKYDLHAVEMMGANIELWRYRLFVDGSLSLEEIFRRSYSTTRVEATAGKNLVMVAAGKKAAITRATATYTVEEHFKGKPQKMRDIAIAVQEYVMGLDAAMEESPKKFYIAYKTSQNIVCMEIRKSKILLYVKLNPKEFSDLSPIGRDVSEIGHSGTGDLELTLRKMEDLQTAWTFISMAYNKVGG